MRLGVFDTLLWVEEMHIGGLSFGVIAKHLCPLVRFHLLLPLVPSLKQSGCFRRGVFYFGRPIKHPLFITITLPPSQSAPLTSTCLATACGFFFELMLKSGLVLYPTLIKLFAYI